MSQTKQKGPEKLTRAERTKQNKTMYEEVKTTELQTIKDDQQAIVAVVKLGRPSSYSQKRARIFCAYISSGMSLRTACKQEGMPDAKTIFKWMHDNKIFLQQYTHATEERAEAMHEDLLDIADDGHNDWMDRYYGEQVEWVTNGEALQRSKLRVETRRWLMERMKPKKYGNKVDITSDGKELPTPILGIVQLPNVNSNITPDVKPRKYIEPGAEKDGDI